MSKKNSGNLQNPENFHDVQTVNNELCFEEHRSCVVIHMSRNAVNAVSVAGGVVVGVISFCALVAAASFPPIGALIVAGILAAAVTCLLRKCLQSKKPVTVSSPITNIVTPFDYAEKEADEREALSTRVF